jgi:2-keto-4-pentenoate hydratase/2-oxohepta-3-ene-1,7-dioic acid hydratase in catechol pathway
MSGQRLPWEISKAFDGSAPIGEFISVESVGDVNNLDFRLEINNRVVQQSNTSDLIFGIDEIISYVSRFFTLKTGDLIITGTPSGVGSLKKNDNLGAYIGDRPVLDFMIR